MACVFVSDLRNLDIDQAYIQSELYIDIINYAHSSLVGKYLVRSCV